MCQMSTTAKPKLRTRIQVRCGQYHGQSGWHIIGKDASGASVRIFSKSAAEVRRMAADIRAGKEPHFDQQLASSASQVECDNCITVARASVRHECFCTPEQLARREALVREAMRMMQGIADQLRDTADGLRTWQRNGQNSGPGAGRAGVHPIHAANRLEKIAERISAREARRERVGQKNSITNKQRD